MVCWWRQGWGTGFREADGMDVDPAMGEGKALGAGIRWGTLWERGRQGAGACLPLPRGFRWSFGGT